MSPWRWIPLITLSLILTAATSPSAASDPLSPTSAGPVSAEEARILWHDGKDAMAHGLTEDAVPRLERFVARYPGYPDYLEARHLLAQAYLKLGEPAKAEKELRAFVLARGKSAAALEARAELIRARLELKKFDEAVLGSDELIKLTPRADQATLHAEALVLRARSQIGQNQDDRAQASLASATQSLPAGAPLRLRGESSRVGLELKLRRCRRFPSREKLEEAQVRDQLGRRGSCLLEALLDYRDLLRLDDPDSTEEASDEITAAYDSYWKSCRNPPAPPPIRPRDRDAKQLKTYFRELSVVLEEDCRQKIHQGLDLIKGWKPSLPLRANEALTRTAGSLEALR